MVGRGLLGFVEERWQLVVALMMCVDRIREVDGGSWGVEDSPAAVIAE
eukprot:CAMPEP_0119512082 /NCGR_PEP_ID=MMETSP1344-20130328/30547_1 /TAXON_ID=236787 /ORGANISM="Florenciella parvula, Strain CCMP2471" /LENGTH=47 /DNA_ID= /DNA_START= /DNA_END= /DNA_ORIENTATION=